MSELSLNKWFIWLTLTEQWYHSHMNISHIPRLGNNSTSRIFNWPTKMKSQNTKRIKNEFMNERRKTINELEGLLNRRSKLQCLFIEDLKRQMTIVMIHQKEVNKTFFDHCDDVGMYFTASSVSTMPNVGHWSSDFTHSDPFRESVWPSWLLTSWKTTSVARSKS